MTCSSNCRNSAYRPGRCRSIREHPILERSGHSRRLSEKKSGRGQGTIRVQRDVDVGATRRLTTILAAVPLAEAFEMTCISCVAGHLGAVRISVRDVVRGLIGKVLSTIMHVIDHANKSCIRRDDGLPRR